MKTVTGNYYNLYHPSPAIPSHASFPAPPQSALSLLAKRRPRARVDTQISKRKVIPIIGLHALPVHSSIPEELRSPVRIAGSVLVESVQSSVEILRAAGESVLELGLDRREA
jgi:hypothetical protein